MDIVIFDIETKESFQEIGQRDPEKLSLSCIGAYSYNHDQYRVFLESELNDLWLWLNKTALLVGYNSKYFDIPVVARYWPAIKKINNLDLHEEIQKSAGHRVSLNSIAEATLGSQKSANGLEAIKMFKEGRIEDLKKYCLDDVKITKEIYEFGKKEGRVFCTSFPEKKEILVNFNPEIIEPDSLELSLGF